MEEKIKFGKTKTAYKGKIFSILHKNVSFPNGDKQIFEFCLRPDSVIILPFDKKGRLLLIYEFRHGYGRRVYFLPAGRVDKGESPAAAARRELREETGFSAKRIKKFRHKSPGNTMLWNVSVFAAKNLFRAPLNGDEHFAIKVVPTPLRRAVKMAENGVIEDEFIAYNIIRFHSALKRGEFKW